MIASTLSSAIESANLYLTDSGTTPGETFGAIVGSTYGPVGAFVGGTLGRMVERAIKN